MNKSLYNEYRNGLWFDPKEKEINKIFYVLENSNFLINSDRCCYAFVYGKQRKRKFTQISLFNGIEVVSIDFYGPKVLKIFNFLISGYSGLIRLDNSISIGKLMRTLSDLSMIGIFSFDSELEKDFLKYHKENNYKSYYPEEFIKKDPSYFSFILDGDNLESESGVLGIVSYGKECPKELSQVFINFEKYGYLRNNLLSSEK